MGECHNVLLLSCSIVPCSKYYISMKNMVKPGVKSINAYYNMKCDDWRHILKPNIQTDSRVLYIDQNPSLVDGVWWPKPMFGWWSCNQTLCYTSIYNIWHTSLNIFSIYLSLQLISIIWIGVVTMAAYHAFHILDLFRPPKLYMYR